jgi:hypothetical protein
VKMTLGEKVFWAVIGLSSVGAAWYGYQRFKLIRPDLYGTPQAVSIPEAEREARIAEYQQKGDALTRAGTPPARTLKPGETCANGVVVTIVRDGDKAEAKAVVENGVPVHCDSSTPQQR